MNTAVTTRRIVGKAHPLTPEPNWEQLQSDDLAKFFSKWTKDSLDSEFAFSPQEQFEMMQQ